MDMECYTPIDHSCEAWPADDSIIPGDVELHSGDRDYFCVKIVAVLSTRSEEEGGFSVRTHQSTERVETFLVPCDDLIQNDGSWSAISTMLSAVDVPLHIQPNMVYSITQCARGMAQEEADNGRQPNVVLPMMVSIYLEEFVEDYEEDYEEDEEEEGGELDNEFFRQAPPGKASVEGLESARVEGFGNRCVVCQEELLVGSEVKLTPCSHVYHGDCIAKWLGLNNFCPLCRFKLPTTLIDR